MEGTIIAAGLGAGFSGGFLIGYALKKVAKLVAIVLGLFFGGLAFLEHQGLFIIKWDQLQNLTQGAANTLVNVTQNGAPDIVSQLGLESLGIPMTGGMSAGFTVGFMKG